MSSFIILLLDGWDSDLGMDGLALSVAAALKGGLWMKLGNWAH